MSKTKPGATKVAALGGMTARRFLREYWQKRPLLVRQAFPAFRDFLTRDELAGLSCEPDVESRLVLERGGRRPWEVVRGPQDEARLRRLPESHWTLLVEGADRHVPALGDLLEAFSFLPRWRVDDVMVSFAAPKGTVGPHIDRYDVFLLQGQGQRRWQVDARAADEYRQGLDLRILRSFEASAEWRLETGDMLYLPPGLAHFGISENECLTYSIGFRAPRVSDLVMGCLERLGRRMDQTALYEDPDLEWQAEPGEIGARALAALSKRVEDAWSQSRKSLPGWLGEILTEPAGAGAAPRARRLGPRELRLRLRPGSVLVRHPASRASFVGRGAKVRLFVDGRGYSLPVAIAEAGPLLSRKRRIPRSELAHLLGEPAFLELLSDLVNAGSFAVEPSPRPRPTRADPRARPQSPPARGSRPKGAGRSGGGATRGGRRGA